MNQRERDLALRLLQNDLAGEHAAIIQYMQHVWRIGEAGGDLNGEISEIARDEMRHFRWVAELVVDLGSDPTIERDVIYINGSPPADLMLLDVDAEDRAIRQYLDHLHQIDDRRISRVIERILVDERAHKEMFRGFVEELGGDPDAPTPRPDVGPFSGQRASAGDIQRPAQSEQAEADSPGTPRVASPETQAAAAAQPEAFGAYSQTPTNEVVYVKPYQPPSDLKLPPGHDQLIAALNSDIGQEYTTVLQYLFQSFVHKRNRLGHELQIDLAQWHMKHWGWLAEHISDMGGEVSTAHDDIDRRRDAPYILRQDLAHQRELAAHYAERQQQVEDEDIEGTYARIQAHDEFQTTQLQDLLDAVEEASTPQPFTPAAGGEAAEPPPTPRLTIGSLFGRQQDD